jgi:hypothetical protein
MDDGRQGQEEADWLADRRWITGWGQMTQTWIQHERLNNQTI